ncbi:hypothetical protein OC835_001664 [Tilletia horrida]|nr:hypothetical protein OC835_001664 [Tilletia horrida]
MSSASGFDPNLHLAPYVEPEYRLSMKDLGLDDAPAPIGVTAPFKLCTLEGVKALRRDLFRPAVLERYLVHSSMTGPHAQLRGHAAETARVVYDFWTAPETLAMVSKAAGCEVMPVFDLELGHVNIQVPSGMSREAYSATLTDDPFASSTAVQGKAEAQADEVVDLNNLVVDWHKDAYPIVCVLMLSDVSSMRGGETAIKRGDGSIIKALGPEIGCAVLMQGGYITHAALPCFGSAERITMVTSFRPRDAALYRDVSNLRNITICSDWNELYDQWVASRIEIVQQKLARYQEMLQQRRRALERQAQAPAIGRVKCDLVAPTVDLAEFARIIEDVDDHLRRALSEMKPYDSNENPGFVWGRPRRSSSSAVQRLTLQEESVPTLAANL